MDYKARFYSPRLGRFTQPDTIIPGMSSQAYNRYSYVNNNPIMMTDPSGHRPAGACEEWENCGGGEGGGGDIDLDKILQNYVNTSDHIIDPIDLKRCQWGADAPKRCESKSPFKDYTGITAFGARAEVTFGADTGGVDMNVDAMIFMYTGEYDIFITLGVQKDFTPPSVDPIPDAGGTVGLVLATNAFTISDLEGKNVTFGADISAASYHLESDLSISASTNSHGRRPTTLFVGGGRGNEDGAYVGVSQTWTLQNFVISFLTGQLWDDIKDLSNVSP